MPAVTYLSDSEAKQFATVEGDKECDELLQELNRISGRRWPFASVDSTDIARNHNRPQHTPRAMADRWDAIQCAPRRIDAPAEQLTIALPPGRRALAEAEGK